MTNQRNPRGQPGHAAQPRPDDAGRVVRPRPSDLAAAAAARTASRLALVALLVAILAGGIAVWRFLAPASDSACQTAAWDATPATNDLPTGWTISTSQFGVGQKQMTLLGPAPQDDTSSQAVVYATITCFPQGAADSVTRSADAATAAGQTVTARTDLGDQGFTATDDSSGAVFLQFRHGAVVVYLATSGDATADEVDGLASAFDLAMGGNGAEAPVGTPDTGGASPSEGISSPGASEETPTESPAAPELESALPTKVGDIQLTVESAVGASILGDDQGSRAITAALRAAGKQPEDLRVAQAYDASDQPADLSILAIRVEGMKLDALKSLVLNSWLTASGAGVKQDTVTLGGKTFTRIDYGDEGTKNYVLAEGDMVRIIETGDADIAAQAAAALP